MRPIALWLLPIARSLEAGEPVVVGEEKKEAAPAPPGGGMY